MGSAELVAVVDCEVEASVLEDDPQLNSLVREYSLTVSSFTVVNSMDTDLPTEAYESYVSTAVYMLRVLA